MFGKSTIIVLMTGSALLYASDSSSVNGAGMDDSSVPRAPLAHTSSDADAAVLSSRTAPHMATRSYERGDLWEIVNGVPSSSGQRAHLPSFFQASPRVSRSALTDAELRGWLASSST